MIIQEYINICLAIAIAMILITLKVNEKRLKLVEAELNGWKEK